MSQYFFVTFAPVQGFIEKTRKLRDLYGASMILCYLSVQLVKFAGDKQLQVISPGMPGYSKGMPNRILLKGDLSKEAAGQQANEFEAELKNKWGELLTICREKLESIVDDCCQRNNEEKFGWDTWGREWDKWKNYSWELFWGMGATPNEARKNLETRKLSRKWTAINWIGESSSLSGSDAIAYPRLEAGDIKLTNGYPYAAEKQVIDRFYRILSRAFDELNSPQNVLAESPAEIEGKIIAENERVSIPELVKRLVTIDDFEFESELGIQTPMSFKEIYRRSEKEKMPSHWTGWFMADGDRMGDHLTTLATKGNDADLESFSRAIREWGKSLEEDFPKTRLGRIIYAGGDDFLGVIYSTNSQKPIPGDRAFQQIIDLHKSWERMQSEKLLSLVNTEVTLSMGFVWAGASVPQRDVLQHCREAEKISKNQGRNRITIRILFNNGQYLDWTTPWEYLNILNSYQDLDGASNWSHVYRDMAQLKSRHAFGFGVNDLEDIDENVVVNFCEGALEFLEIYFPEYSTNPSELPTKTKEILQNQQFEIFGENATEFECNCQMILWIDRLISVGWHLLGDRDSST